ncbi:hypothetical protein P691DRAFT_779134 [Macrolepiota fuliginosa MF-IS2]|uniref:Guanylate-binding protein N-terminal domain-containing protein n=1 Tax=Macrolepiota fuliginosa MF-IS2 TaxID=1400762 RepID=A0A9P6BYT2_9AGAR|nr:hypothetical protein P691DRAFT_779134 [Macrolepiota fuliginosa MF-IS2]
MAETIKTMKAIRQDDIVIAFMGPTGAGKSYLIDLLSGQRGRRAGDTLKSCTAQIQATRVRHPRYKDRIVLVDTPGFDDTTKSDMEILALISEWLQKTYQRDIKLCGLVYLHRITDNRMAGSPLKNLRMFGNLCGDVAMNRVILLSTMWPKIKPEVGIAREAELRNRFWAPLIERGSSIARLQDSNSAREAWNIIEALIKAQDDREAVLLQEELVDLEKNLNETQAGKTLYTSLQKLLDGQRESLKKLLEQVEDSRDPSLARELKKEYQRMERDFQKTFDEVKKLKIPLGKRILDFLFGKRARAPFGSQSTSGPM